MNIKVRIKTSYGRDLIYPECDKSKYFAAIAKKKTLDKTDIQNIKNLGFEVIVVAAQQSL